MVVAFFEKTSITRRSYARKHKNELSMPLRSMSPYDACVDPPPKPPPPHGVNFFVDVTQTRTLPNRKPSLDPVKNKYIYCILSNRSKI